VKTVDPQTLRNLEETYQGIGNFLKKSGGNYRGCVFTGNLEMIKKSVYAQKNARLYLTEK